MGGCKRGEGSYSVLAAKDRVMVAGVEATLVLAV